jgi:hypothetical protein
MTDEEFIRSHAECDYLRTAFEKATRRLGAAEEFVWERVVWTPHRDTAPRDSVSHVRILISVTYVGGDGRKNLEGNNDDVPCPEGVYAPSARKALMATEVHLLRCLVLVARTYAWRAETPGAENVDNMYPEVVAAHELEDREALQ